MNQNTDFIPFARPSISREEENAVLAVLRSGWLTTGRVAREFEKEFAAFCGVPYALAVNSATAGLHLSLEALGIVPGSRVITTPYTFTATAEVITYLGADPLFVDIDSDSLNLDIRLVEKTLEQEIQNRSRDGRIQALLPVHLGGLACNIEEFCTLGSHYGLPVVEDAAHAFPLRLPAGFAGTFGQSGVFSFYATKTITTGEGGMVVTRDASLAERIQIMRLHGIDREAWDRHSGKQAAWHYRIVEAGYKYNLTDLAAAIGREQLKKADLFLEKRRRIAARYLEALADCSFLILPENSPYHAWHLFCIRLKPGSLNLSRDDFIRELQQQGIGTSVHYIPLHIMPYYRKRYGFKPGDFPRALEAYSTCLSLPVYPDLSPGQTERIIAAVIKTGRRWTKRQAYQGADL